MKYIEGHWETIDDLRDISRVIREYYNRELADEIDKLIEIQENKIKSLKEEMINAENWWIYNAPEE
mgnify:CR=1 FL=1